MIRAAPGSTFEAVAQFASGLVGTVGARVRTSTGSDFLARTTSGIAADVTVGSTTVYRRAFTAPTVAGQYLIVFDDTTNIVTEELVVAWSTGAEPSPSGRDLCSLDDVKRYVPGYQTNTDTDDTLTALITAQTRSIYRNTGREFVAISGANPRIFDLNRSIVARRAFPLGDAATVTQAELFDYDGTTSLGVISPSLYTLLPRTREEWEPYTRIQFPYRPGGVVLLAPGRTLAITGTWGFPFVPEDIREACAILALISYFADAATAGTDLSDVLDPTYNVNGLLRFALSTVEGYADPSFA